LIILLVSFGSAVFAIVSKLPAPYTNSSIFSAPYPTFSAVVFGVKASLALASKGLSKSH